ncbi:hypothetical protein COU95_02100 [Candidatus Shapirobacteria bacterium CG10_big_fil_rev_8_21_14_0_10_40_9]|uniref:Uncharacterized protein n=1 Tax=Candidatus Shapirobacteria bacterium CG10_big_fil_rev_8_21_14_0_10_40_9 TaxID=1974888 RepID=A0A2M8L3M2_9BACT|nr:MAG: hypothetical protein COU95_02100 [Candidatus Shapirobacteria bacterium CG10_big_fil_rev_8_21_14_0_10_40_9]
MSKRQKFILTSAVLAGGLLAIQTLEPEFRYQAIFGLTVACALLTLWSLREALSGIRFLTTAILPTLFTAGVGLFYFLLPANIFSQLPVVALYAVGIYALLLTENIFSVAAIRTIQLLRAAHAVGFLLTLLTAFFLFDTIFSFRISGWWNSLLVFGVSLPLFLQGLWSVNLEEKLTRRILDYTFFLSLVSGELAFIISFYPVTIAMASLFLTTSIYVTLGLVQAEFQERLFKQTIYEYLGVGIVVLAVMLGTAKWGG